MMDASAVEGGEIDQDVLVVGMALDAATGSSGRGRLV
jgi:hypothetical protein